MTVLLAIVVAGAAQDRWGIDAVSSSPAGRRSASASGTSAVGSSGGRRRRVEHPAVGPARRAQPRLRRVTAPPSNYSGNGFVAAFVAGLVFGAATRGELREATEFTDTVGLFSSFVVWVIFGAAFVGPVLRGGVHARTIIYAVISLTVVRMVPVAIALIGARLRVDTIGFIGWFGPRGLASVVFTLIAVDALGGQTLAHGTGRGHDLDDPALGHRPRPQLRATRRTVRPAPQDGPGRHSRARHGGANPDPQAQSALRLVVSGGCWHVDADECALRRKPTSAIGNT